MNTENIPKVKLLAAILYGAGAPEAQCLEMLQSRFSATDVRGAAHPFTRTGYYEPEMGAGLKRRLVSFTQLVEPGALVQAKLAAREIEQALSVDGRRRVNVDMGYLDLFKLVLASAKGRGNKLYLSGMGGYDVDLSAGGIPPPALELPGFRRRHLQFGTERNSRQFEGPAQGRRRLLTA